MKNVMSGVMSDVMQDVFASDSAPVVPTYNVVGFYDYLDTFSTVSYYKMDQVASPLTPSGADTSTDLNLTTSGGTPTYSGSFSTYTDAPSYITYDGTVAWRSSGFAAEAHPTMSTTGDQTMAIIFDQNGTLSGNAAVYSTGGSIASELETNNIQGQLQLQTNYQVRAFHEYGAGNDETSLWNAIPPDSQFSGEQFVFLTRDNTAKQYELLYDVSGTLTSQGTDSFTNDPTSTATTQNKVAISGRNGDGSNKLPSGFRLGLVLGASEVLDTSYMQTMVTKAREGASSGSIYFEANLS